MVSIKRFDYRGVTDEEYANEYMLTGSTPADTTAWAALRDALWAQEKTVVSSVVQFRALYGYNSVDPTATAIYSYRDISGSPLVGTYAGVAADRQSGDAAVWVRWGLDRFNTKGKRVYLRKYFHPAYASSGSYDTVAASWVTAGNAFGTKMRDGTFLDGRVVVDKLGTLSVGALASPYITTRTLKRRGKRPPT